MSSIKRTLPYLLIAAFALPLGAYVYLAQFSRFIADDFCVAARVHAHGIIGGVLVDYTTWAGRLAASFSYSTAILSGPQGVMLHPVLVLTACLLALFWLVYELAASLGLKRAGIVAALSACLLLTGTLDGSPGLYQSLYWLTSLYIYFASLVPFVIVLALIVRRTRRQWRGMRNRVGLLAIFVLAFAAGTCSESFAGLQTTLFAVALFSLVITKQRHHPAALPVLLATIASLIAIVVLVVAPGNAVRQTSFERSDSLIGAGIEAFIHALAFMVASLVGFSPGSTFAILVISVLIAWQFSSTPLLWSRPVRGLLILMPLGITFILIAAFMFPAMYAMRVPPPSRAYILAQFIIVCALAATGYLLGLATQRRWQKASSRRTLVFSGLVAAAIVLSPVLILARTVNLVPLLSTFAADFDQREQTIYDAVEQGETHLTVAPLRVDVAVSTGLDTIGTNPSEWVNGCAAQYYGLESLQTSSSSS